MEHKNIKTRKDVFEKFEELRSYLRFKKGINKTQSQFVEILIENYTHKAKGKTNGIKI